MKERGREMRQPAPFLDRNLTALEREIAQARKMLKRLEAMASDDLRLGFSANHVRELVAEYRASVRAMLDRRDDLVSRVSAGLVRIDGAHRYNARVNHSQHVSTGERSVAFPHLRMLRSSRLGDDDLIPTSVFSPPSER